MSRNLQCCSKRKDTLCLLFLIDLWLNKGEWKGLSSQPSSLGDLRKDLYESQWQFMILIDQTGLNTRFWRAPFFCVKPNSNTSWLQVVEGKHTVYRMSASTEEEKDDWIKCIQWVAVARLVKLLPLNPITYISCHFSLVLSFCMERQLTGRAC